MTGGDDPVATEQGRRARLRRLRAQAFGDVLPERSTDETEQGWGDRESGANDEEWLRRQVPPHHG